MAKVAMEASSGSKQLQEIAADYAELLRVRRRSC
jgi:hypothetical protein